jgi:predicted XRE-type DNA-binding protein
MLNPLNFPTDVIIGASQGLDAEAISKARNIINSAVIQELEQEDLSRSGIYEKVIRQHVISHLQHLRISLFTVETLMSLYNEHAEKINAETA